MLFDRRKFGRELFCGEDAPDHGMAFLFCRGVGRVLQVAQTSRPLRRRSCPNSLTHASHLRGVTRFSVPDAKAQTTGLMPLVLFERRLDGFDHAFQILPAEFFSSTFQQYAIRRSCADNVLVIRTACFFIERSNKHSVQKRMLLHVNF